MRGMLLGLTHVSTGDESWTFIIIIIIIIIFLHQPYIQGTRSRPPLLPLRVLSRSTARVLLSWQPPMVRGQQAMAWCWARPWELSCCIWIR